MSREDIEANLDQNPQLLTLTNRVLWAAGHSGQDRVLRILAGFLADAIRQPSLADEVTALMGSLESLSEHHIRVLELCSTPAPDAAANEPNPLARYWNEKQILEHAGFRSELVAVALRGLAGAGLLDDRKNDTWDSVLTPMFQVTEMGNAVLDALRKVTPAD
ncbi:hypothetical protein GCM10009547_39700 [Sporichthya brevicatena]|uniref:MarR family transcriptional regulator n=2 Tax=Sporichthya brevicatena TaxID=171442 RepID=A0ABN1H7Q0_9ACTN